MGKKWNEFSEGQVPQKDDDSHESESFESISANEQEFAEALHAASLASDYVDNLPALNSSESDDPASVLTFSIEPTLLYAATVVTKLSNREDLNSTVEVYPEFLRVSASKGLVTYRADVRLSDKLDNLCQKVAFDIRHRQLLVLSDIGKKAGHGRYHFKFLHNENRLIHFALNLPKRLTTLNTERPSNETSKAQTEISLITYPPSQLSGSLHGGEGIAFDPAALLRALKYVKPSCAPNDAEPQKAGIVIADGRALGGQPKAFSVYEESGLSGINLHIPYGHIHLVERALRRLEHAKARLFKSGATSIVSDGVIHCEITSEPLAYKGMVLGIERFMKQPNDLVIVSRDDLLKGVLACASIIPNGKGSKHSAEDAPDISLQLQKPGEGDGMLLSTAYRGGRYTARYLADVQHAAAVPGGEAISLRVDLAILQSAIEQHEDQIDEVKIYMQPERGLLIENTGKLFKAKTLLWHKEPQTGRI